MRVAMTGWATLVQSPEYGPEAVRMGRRSSRGNRPTYADGLALQPIKLPDLAPDRDIGNEVIRSFIVELLLGPPSQEGHPALLLRLIERVL